MIRLVKSIALGFGLLLLSSFAGVVHPLGDSLAVFRVPLATVFGVSVIWTNWPRRVRWPLVAVVCLVIWPHAQARFFPPEIQTQGIVLYQQNLLFSRKNTEGWLAELRRQDPDFVTLQEVSRQNAPLLDVLRADYPSQHYCPQGAVMGEAVLSRFEMVPGTGRCSIRDGFAAMQVIGPDGPVWIVSIHFNWPWPYGQASQVSQVLPELETLSGPVIVGGDFNAVAWSYTVRRISKATGTQRIGPYLPTFLLSRFRLPLGIDHVLTSATGHHSLQIVPRHGSDHFGVVATIAPENGD